MDLESLRASSVTRSSRRLWSACRRSARAAREEVALAWETRESTHLAAGKLEGCPWFLHCPCTSLASSSEVPCRPPRPAQAARHGSKARCRNRSVVEACWPDPEAEPAGSAQKRCC